ncbi:uncharacterized protein [Vicugna pacos]|uniref:Uncharacterized protein n=1 Tax=Vicugna pacos TaxID=30538 RepID=A0ABM5DGG8_VICPA
MWIKDGKHMGQTFSPAPSFPLLSHIWAELIRNPEYSFPWHASSSRANLSLCARTLTQATPPDLSKNQSTRAFLPSSHFGLALVPALLCPEAPVSGKTDKAKDGLTGKVFVKRTEGCERQLELGAHSISQWVLDGWILTVPRKALSQKALGRNISFKQTTSVASKHVHGDIIISMSLTGISMRKARSGGQTCPCSAGSEVLTVGETVHRWLGRRELWWNWLMYALDTLEVRARARKNLNSSPHDCGALVLRYKGPKLSQF